MPREPRGRGGGHRAHAGRRGAPHRVRARHPRPGRRRRGVPGLLPNLRARPHEPRRGGAAPRRARAGGGAPHERRGHHPERAPGRRPREVREQHAQRPLRRPVVPDRGLLALQQRDGPAAPRPRLEPDRGRRRRRAGRPVPEEHQGHPREHRRSLRRHRQGDRLPEGPLRPRRRGRGVPALLPRLGHRARRGLPARAHGGGGGRASDARARADRGRGDRTATAPRRRRWRPATA